MFTALLPVHSITVLFSVMQLKEFFLFEQIWMAGLRLSNPEKEGGATEEKKEPDAPAPDSVEPEQQLTNIIERTEKFIGRLRERVSVFVLLSLGQLDVQNNLGQSIGQVGVSLSKLSLRLNIPEYGETVRGASCVPPDVNGYLTHSQMPRTVISMDASLEKVALLSEGSLNGSAAIRGIVRRPHRFLTSLTLRRRSSEGGMSRCSGAR
jgi:hypothetical protein